MNCQMKNHPAGPVTKSPMKRALTSFHLLQNPPKMLSTSYWKLKGINILLMANDADMLVGKNSKFRVWRPPHPTQTVNYNDISDPYQHRPTLWMADARNKARFDVEDNLLTLQLVYTVSEEAY
eukprot:jgi/Psemu1/2460/gm1.2460_g